MNLNEFIDFGKNCIVCGGPTILTMSGSIKEEIGSDTIRCLFSYLVPVIRKNFITFAVSSFHVVSLNDFLDTSTFNKQKYSSFLLNSEGYISFDYDFSFKMKLMLNVMCPQGHYSYASRLIRVSDTSPDITKGWPVASEQLNCDIYQVISKQIEDKTYIYNIENPQNPVIIPYMDIKSFPNDDPDKFVKKVQNILLLA
jgi:hypothetical protein